jgi:hypothetical protein
MEEKPRSVSSSALYYGLITGAAMILYSLILFLAGLHMNKTMGYIGYVILILGMVWGTLDYRKKYLGGFMPYGKAFTSCFMIGLFSGILGTIYMYLFAQFIHPGFGQEILDAAREQLAGRNMTEEQMDQALAMQARFMSPVAMAIWALVMSVIGSAILGLIVAIFLRKEDKSAASQF